MQIFHQAIPAFSDHRLLSLSKLKLCYSPRFRGLRPPLKQCLQHYFLFSDSEEQLRDCSPLKDVVVTEVFLVLDLSSFENWPKDSNCHL